MSGVLKIVINVILFIAFMTMVVLGQRSIGYAGLSVMMIGLIGLLGQLWAYNRQYR